MKVNKLQAYYDAFTAWILACSATDRALALVWYARHGSSIASERGSLSIFQACSVFASLSANVRLDGNWRLYRQFVQTGHAATVPCGIEGALRAVTVDGMESVNAITVVGSKAHKTKAFARSLLAGLGQYAPDNIYDPRWACLDRWMNRAATGDMSLMPPPSHAEYPIMAEALSLVAVDCRLPIWLVQAMIWCAIQTATDVNWIASDPIMAAFRLPPTITNQPILRGNV
jgi:hypothetical protein